MCGSGICQSDAGVAHQAAPLGALYGTSAKGCAESVFAHGGQPFKTGQEERFFVVSLGNDRGRLLWDGRGRLWESSWLKFFGLRDWGAPIPGADVLANVTAEDVTAHGLAQGLGNGAAKLDRQVGDAEARIHHVGFDERSRGAGIDAFCARAAEIGD